MDCINCGAVITEILAEHEYTIEQNSETGQWTKTVGNASYSCPECGVEFNISELTDILKQVDEL